MSVRFTLSTFEGHNPAYLTERDCHLATASFWTLHVPVDDTVEALAERFCRTGAEVLTGDFTGGDSYWQHCEPAQDGEQQALHVYFTASSAPEAARIAEALCIAVQLDPAEMSVTPARDWEPIVPRLAA